MSKRQAADPLEPPETKVQYTLRQVMSSAGSLADVLELPPPPTAPAIDWAAKLGPADPHPLSGLTLAESNAVQNLPAFQETEAYFEELGGGDLDLAMLVMHGWRSCGECDFDTRYTGFRFSRDNWHLLVAVDGEALVYWKVVTSTN